MPVLDSALLSVLTGSGVCGVFCILFVFGVIVPRPVVDDVKAENKELKEALASERSRADAAVAAASATRDILAAIRLGRDITSGRDP